MFRHKKYVTLKVVCHFSCNKGGSESVVMESKSFPIELARCSDTSLRFRAFRGAAFVGSHGFPHSLELLDWRHVWGLGFGPFGTPSQSGLSAFGFGAVPTVYFFYYCNFYF